MSQSDDDLMLDALKLNWEHARHLEGQRLQMTVVYIATLGAGVTLVADQQGATRALASSAGLLLTMFCWGMIDKWNLEVVNQIRTADKCARWLKVASQTTPGDTDELHAYIGFPVRRKRRLLAKLNVRLMFTLLFIVSTVIWLVLLVSCCFEF